MTYSEFTQKHLETLAARLETVGIDAKLSERGGWPKWDIMMGLEAKCKVAGLSIEIEPPAVNIETRGGITRYQSSGDVVVNFTDYDNMKENDEDED